MPNPIEPVAGEAVNAPAQGESQSKLTLRGSPMKFALFSPHRSQAENFVIQPVLLIIKYIFTPSRFPSGSTAWKSRERFGTRDFQASRSKSGLTLVELTISIAVILVLVGAASLAIKPYFDYRDGRAAGEALRSVKAAQLMYLADNPSTPVANLTQTLLLPYMPNGTWPTLPSVNGQVPTINCAVFPPVAVLGGATYDPSGSPNDGLWDVGRY
jgi:prepilin-type N-terminal cleavage/methylation domain-containing protein